MLINCGDAEVASHVRFVNYTGKWPGLCYGVLTLNIDGKEVRFGNNTGTDYPKFWCSGGRCTMEHIEKGEWQIDVSELPEEFRKYAAEIDRVFNKNVDQGCCGGCR